MVWLMASATGLIVASLYYAQPLVGPISRATGLDAGAAGLIVTLTQLGYCLGMLFIVPLGDLFENRRMIVTALCVSALALAAAAFSTSAAVFLAACFCIGLGSTAAQIIVPFAAHLSRPEKRGQTVGTVVSGLLMGIMLARPVSSLVTDALGWHAIFILSSIWTAALALLLKLRLPLREPEHTSTYAALLGSMWHLLKTTPILRRRAAYQFCMFGAFSLFWTTVPLVLASDAFGLSQTGIAMFALAGIAGAIVSPIAGRRADQGKSRSTTGMALAAGVLSFAVPLLVHGERTFALGLLVAASIVLDAGVSGSLVVGQRAIYSLGADVRSRLNGLYMAIFFMGGALGSMLGAWMYAHHGWQGVLMTGLVFPALGLAVFATEKRQH
ncbi:MFS transporter [Pseudoduganella plicata]|uniref:MFS transporter n=1 Tax=Pseudoduganella plicata TaxID=321984 RepID=A0A4P7BM76_9BURK|nr:MFS transporter [Pseudoduganella plicata]QBQ39543.1 MFS transporter [Pseudoduganella plicata]GGY83545.1 putative MFS-type transporter YdeR [Pseudoduganella plicata]